MPALWTIPKLFSAVKVDSDARLVPKPFVPQKMWRTCRPPVVHTLEYTCRWHLPRFSLCALFASHDRSTIRRRARGCIYGLSTPLVHLRATLDFAQTRPGCPRPISYTSLQLSTGVVRHHILRALRLAHDPVPGDYRSWIHQRWSHGAHSLFQQSPRVLLNLIVHLSISPPVLYNLTLPSEGLVLPERYDIETAQWRLRPSLMEFARTGSPRERSFGCRPGPEDEVKIASSYTLIDLLGLTGLPEELRFTPTTGYHRFTILRAGLRKHRFELHVEDLMPLPQEFKYR